MALINGVGLFVASVLAAALSRIVVEEIGAWSPSIILSLIKLAVAWLPENQRGRFEEEWQSHVNELPGTVGKLLAAAGFVLAAHQMTLTARRNQVVEDASHRLARMEDVLSKMTLVVNTIRDAKSLLPDHDFNIFMARLDELEELRNKLATAVTTASAMATIPLVNLLYAGYDKVARGKFDPRLCE